MMYREGAYVIEPVFPTTMGYEGAGVVTAVGTDVSEFSVGDKVSVIPSFMFTEYGTYGEIVNMPVHAVVKHPENLTMEQAAASWMMFVTAYGGLIEFGKVQKGDFVVLGGATSSVGIAAIQIAKMQGANVIALSRTHAKGDVLLQKGADFVIATKEDDVTCRLSHHTSESITGTSTSTPTTVANAAPECKPNKEIATATANSKKLLVPIKQAGAEISCGNLSHFAKT